VHLVWAPLGAEPLRAFLRSYAAHAAGVEHELVIVLNGLRAEASGVDAPAPLTLAGAAAELRGVEHRSIVLERPLLDLAAYGVAAARLEHEWLCCLNSYSVILAGGWLARLARVAELPDVGLVGATGSWESRAELVPGGAVHWAYQLAKLPRKRRGFPRFPNPHIRTTAFMLRREPMLTLGLEHARDKDRAYLLESGRRSITRQAQARGRRALVVGRDGRGYEPPDWPRSNTYRSGEQANLLVADNRTSEWQHAAPARRRALTHQAWRDARH
jgi:hypothetical protein